MVAANSGNTDDRLIVQLRKGNKLAFKQLFDKYGPRLLSFSFKYLRDKKDAEDLLHEVFLKIWENRTTLKSNTSFQAYLFTIAYNNIRQRFLKKSREEKYIQTFTEEYLQEHSLDEEQLDYIYFQKKLNQFIDLLPTRRKEIFQLSFKNEMKNKEIAEELNVSEQFIKNQVSKARKFIVDKFKEDDSFAGILLFYLLKKCD